MGPPCHVLLPTSLFGLIGTVPIAIIAKFHVEMSLRLWCWVYIWTSCKTRISNVGFNGTWKKRYEKPERAWTLRKTQCFHVNHNESWLPHFRVCELYAKKYHRLIFCPGSKRQSLWEGHTSWVRELPPLVGYGNRQQLTGKFSMMLLSW